MIDFILNTLIGFSVLLFPCLFFLLVKERVFGEKNFNQMFLLFIAFCILIYLFSTVGKIIAMRM